MLPRQRRINKNDWKKRALSSKTFNTNLFSLKINDNKDGTPGKVAVVVSKKVSNSAVLRNKIKRKFVSAVEKFQKEIPNGKMFFFYVRKESLDSDWSNILQEIKNVFSK